MIVVIVMVGCMIANSLWVLGMVWFDRPITRDDDAFETLGVILIAAGPAGSVIILIGSVVVVSLGFLIKVIAFIKTKRPTR